MNLNLNLVFSKSMNLNLKLGFLKSMILNLISKIKNKMNGFNPTAGKHFFSYTELDVAFSSLLPQKALSAHLNQQHQNFFSFYYYCSKRLE